jgi:DNA-binding Lrp family transcriptional regulator
MTSPDNNSLTSELQFRVMRLLEVNPQINQRELSKSLGVSLGGISYCLNALAAKGSIKIQNFRNNKNKWVYTFFDSAGLGRKNCAYRFIFKNKIFLFSPLLIQSYS